jgi:hypothetical protein
MKNFLALAAVIATLVAGAALFAESHAANAPTPQWHQR